jgi:methyl-accepting chemotaxis protein
MKGKNKRRLFPLVNKSHQYRFLSLIVSYSAIIAVVISAALLIPDIMRLQDPTISFEERVHAADKILAIHFRLWPTLLAIICIIGLHSFRVFHRFIGPLYRMTMALKQIKEGDLSFRLEFRSNDFLEQEKIEFNNMLTSVSDKIRSIKDAGVKASASLNKLETSLNSESPEDSAEKICLTELRDELNRLTATIEKFKLEEM